MVTLTSIQPHQTKFDALVEQANGLYAEWTTSTERADELRAQLGRVMRQVKDNKPDGVTWPDLVRARFNFSASWANQLISEAEGRTTPEARRAHQRGYMLKHRAKPLSRESEDRPEKSRSKDLRRKKIVADLKMRLREEQERRERSNDRCKWLSHEWTTAQHVADGLTRQVEALRQQASAPVVVRVREAWQNASAAERAEIRALVNGSAT
jgi:hypothetical protein